MNCDWTTAETGPRGQKLQCSRCGIKTGWTPFGHDRVHSSCTAWPRLRELGYWMELGLAVAGITKQRVMVVASLVGIADCGCKRRIDLLNAAGKAIKNLALPPNDSRRAGLSWEGRGERDS